jgi:hypothetical protein
MAGAIVGDLGLHARLPRALVAIDAVDVMMSSGAGRALVPHHGGAALAPELDVRAG